MLELLAARAATAGAEKVTAEFALRAMPGLLAGLMLGQAEREAQVASTVLLALPERQATTATPLTAPQVPQVGWPGTVSSAPQT